MFSLFNFSSIFQWGSADPIFRYMRTPKDVTESIVTLRLPFCEYNLALCVELTGEDFTLFR